MKFEELIAYEDEFILILDKPPGVLVHPTVKESGSTLYDMVGEYYQQQGLNLGIHPVSRLDRFTSGLVIFAKEGVVQGWLDRGFFEKEYLAVTEGMPPTLSGIIDAPIARKPGSIIERCIAPEGKPALTEYRVIKSGARPILALKLRTGRTHQIRVHLASVGCPVVGDGLYGVPGSQGRHLLHCWKINFQHPLSDNFITVTRLPPEKFF